MCQEVALPTVLNDSIHILRKAKSFQNALVFNTLYMLSLGSFWLKVLLLQDSGNILKFWVVCLQGKTLNSEFLI